MNKRGFTLVEILVVITLMGVIAGIAVPSIYTIANKQKENVKNKQLETILSVSEMYLRDNIDDIQDITVQTLVKEGYLNEEDTKDPTNDEQYLNNNIYFNKNNCHTCSTQNINKKFNIDDNMWCISICK